MLAELYSRVSGFVNRENVAVPMRRFLRESRPRTMASHSPLSDYRDPVVQLRPRPTVEGWYPVMRKGKHWAVLQHVCPARRQRAPFDKPRANGKNSDAHSAPLLIQTGLRSSPNDEVWRRIASQTAPARSPASTRSRADPAGLSSGRPALRPASPPTPRRARRSPPPHTGPPAR